MARPVTGPHRMPQQLCPAAMYALSVPGICPRYGIASGGHGRMHACCWSLDRAANLAIAPKELSAALTRAGSAVISSGEMAFRSSLFRYLLPPIPHMYTSLEARGYTSRWHPLESSAQKSAYGSIASSVRKTMLVDRTPCIGIEMSSNQSSAMQDQGPIATTKQSASITFPSTITPDTLPPSLSTPSTLPITTLAPDLSISALVSSSGVV
mmetsp:Transcript_21180/g.41210  ORF Transcript_21180/g.41210 Transcript_21180/m.41210 type:complete len:210 (+) Transcript_21180:949-1578(+)